MTQDEIVTEAVARALAKADGKDPDAPAWVEGYGNREKTFGVCWRDQYLVKAQAAIAAMQSAGHERGDDDALVLDALETARQRALVLFQSYARGVAERHGRSEGQFVHDVATFGNELADALRMPISHRLQPKAPETDYCGIVVVDDDAAQPSGDKQPQHPPA